MGTIRASFSHFLDVASEQVACSSGVLLSDANIRGLAGRYRISELRGMTRSGGETVFRAEELEEAILSLRVAIGELPDNKMGQFILVDAAKIIWATGGNPQRLAAAYLTVADSGRYQSLTSEAIDEIAGISGQRTEHILAFAAAYLDQRYIDYLAKNGEEMRRMHWRNFERLTTEFFRRQKYEVDLGPGTKDGGVDVRVWTDKEAKPGPPLVLIQRKRTKDVVGIETVKAFWADVLFERAESGLIATTAAVSRDSKTMCEVRQYPLTFAEGAKVKQWARSMWRLRRKGRRSHIAVEIANPVGLASFMPGARPDWFRGWLQMTTQDYSRVLDKAPDTTEFDTTEEGL